MTYRVVQWATGGVGRAAIETVLEHPDLELAGWRVMRLTWDDATVNSERTLRRVRLALGASGWRLARQLLVESFILAGAGATLGLLLAVWGSRVLVSQISIATSPVVLDLALDWRVMAFTAVVTIATVVLFGTAPAFRAMSVAPMDASKDQGRATKGATRANDPRFCDQCLACIWSKQVDFEFDS